MNFLEIANVRQSCRNFDPARAVEPEKLEALLDAARLAPSACNGQPYHLTVCTGATAAAVAGATQSMGMNRFASDAPLQIVLSEKPYVKSAAVGAKLKGNDYRSIDIGIAAAYLTAEAAAQELGSVSSVGSTMRKYAKFAALTGRCGWSSRSAIPKRAIRCAKRSARIKTSWSRIGKKRGGIFLIPPRFNDDGGDGGDDARGRRARCDTRYAHTLLWGIPVPGWRARYRVRAEHPVPRA